MKLQPYLNFDGTCGDAFRLYERVLGGTLTIMTHGDSPMADQTPPEMKDKVMHARLEVGDQAIMGSDAPLNYFQAAGGMHVSITVQSAEEADRIYAGLVEGGRATMPIATTFWSPRFGMLIDRYGTPWMVNYDPRA